jgi:alginate O-acetyltransferase complex protein AlgI
LFATFFPRTIAGPITRYSEVIPQLQRIPTDEVVGHVSVGVVMFSIGFFKKAFVADQLSLYVPSVFDLGPVDVWDPGIPTLVTSWAAVLAYTLQLYFDFSGYSDMALGVARMCGLRLPMNFNSPFKASSIVEFWARWHITLTRFLTAYIYTPLVLCITRARLAKRKPVVAGAHSRASAIASMIAVPILTTMGISGIWHGAGWQFVAWGALHGVYLTVNQAWRLLRPRFWPDTENYSRVMKPVGVIVTFTAVVVALVFFRARSVPDALSILYAMVGGNGVVPSDVSVLRHVGVEVPLALVQQYLPVAPWIWIAILLAWVLFLPNSLEILRLYCPAADYPVGGQHANEGSLARAAGNGAPEKRGVAIRGGELQISLTPLVAGLAAVLCLFGILMLNRSQTFIYWNF